ncbi:MAG: hypothetical protein WDN66_01360 [Candidatus Saccharibacteria bacterium]
MPDFEDLPSTPINNPDDLINRTANPRIREVLAGVHNTGRYAMNILVHNDRLSSVTNKELLVTGGAFGYLSEADGRLNISPEIDPPTDTTVEGFVDRFQHLAEPYVTGQFQIDLYGLVRGLVDDGYPTLGGFVQMEGPTGREGLMGIITPTHYFSGKTAESIDAAFSGFEQNSELDAEFRAKFFTASL